MNILLSMPPNVAGAEDVANLNKGEDVCYMDSDPRDRKLGSGGGTVWIDRRFRAAHPGAEGRKIIIHAGGQSRRLPAYAVTGKSLTPVPVLRWAVGDTIDQTLMSLQIPLLKRILDMAPEGMNTLVASGDVLIRNDGKLPAVPEADVVCYGLWAEPLQACNHGVFFTSRSENSAHGKLEFMRQKPTVAELTELNRTHFYLMDVGLWVLSDKAMKLLERKSMDENGELRFYDLYSQFGCALGLNPSAPDSDLADLTVAVVTLSQGSFYHFGTTRQLIDSTLTLQNIVADQRRILHRPSKPNPALFVQNCVMGVRLTEQNHNVWVENSYVGPGWALSSENVVTGVPQNDWALRLDKGMCVDVVPVDEAKWAVRPYGYVDAMRGDIDSESTRYMGMPLKEWLALRGVALHCPAGTDIQSAPLFPVVDDVEAMGYVVRWMTTEPCLEAGREVWQNAELMSADELMERASLERLFAQRRRLLKTDLGLLSTNPQSVFYQLDLDDTAKKYHDLGLEAPSELTESESVARRLHNHMFRSRVMQLSQGTGADEAEKAFALMRGGILSGIEVSRSVPELSVERDQIVWGRSPVRIDLAGGWTDTPPYSLLHGGSVVNMAVELNGQPPLQVFVKPCKEMKIILRSIDLGAAEEITDYETLSDFARVNSPFSIPKAALTIAGFSPEFAREHYGTLCRQLEAFGSGIELTLLSALPAGSGMGTSSILAATVLGSLSDFCGLGWTNDEICERTLALEQMLTSGGGWQDQYGGVLQGVKLLQTQPGWQQLPSVSWLPDGVFTDAEYAPCHLLYYTGLTRTAKGILAEIVKRMFLNHGPSLRLLQMMKEHSQEMASAIQRRDFTEFGRLVGRSWSQNKALDSGTCSEGVVRIIESVEDLTLGLKLPGAGGGGYLYMVAKDPEAAMLIRRRLAERSAGRFSELTISNRGLQVSRS